MIYPSQVNRIRPWGSGISELILFCIHENQ